MTLHETQVQTRMYGEVGDYDVKVFFSDELRETLPHEIAFSSVHGGFLPYIFTGYFYDKNYQRWFFSNARRHEEMKDAITAYLGREMNYVYGQLHFDPLLMREGKLKFITLTLHGPLPQEAMAQLRREVRRDHLAPISQWDGQGFKLRYFAYKNLSFRVFGIIIGYGGEKRVAGSGIFSFA